MRRYKRRRSRRYLKKYLRRREAQLDARLRALVEGFDPALPPDEEGKNFELLLRLRWLVYDFVHVRLRLTRWWGSRRRFLELPDFDDVKVAGGAVELKGDIVWWADGAEAVGRWWPPDHEPHPTGVYKMKLRGDMRGGHWVLEPFNARLSLSETPGRVAAYEIEFGKGNTFLKVRNR